MRIQVIENNRNVINLLLPTGIVFHTLTAKIVYIVLRRTLKETQADFPVSRQQLECVFQCLKQCKKDFPGLVLVDVESSNGDRVKIKL